MNCKHPYIHVEVNGEGPFYYTGTCTKCHNVIREGIADNLEELSYTLIALERGMDAD